MKAREYDFREKPACSVKRAPVPEAAACPACEDDLEIWSDEDETVCGNCGESVSRNKINPGVAIRK